MQLGDKKLIVQRASVGSKNPLIMEAMGAAALVEQTSMPINIPGLQIPCEDLSVLKIWYPIWGRGRGPELLNTPVCRKV